MRFAPLAALLIAFVPAPLAAAQTVAISGIVDSNFPSVDPNVEQRASQDVCVYSDTPSAGYTVTARGDTPDGTFLLFSQGNEAGLAYELEWSAAPGRATGMTLQPGIASDNFGSSATSLDCSNGAPSSASLIVILRQNALQQALAGVTYEGTVMLTVTPQ